VAEWSKALVKGTSLNRLKIRISDYNPVLIRISDFKSGLKPDFELLEPVFNTDRKLTDAKWVGNANISV
jgi:hypothetical protein